MRSFLVALITIGCLTASAVAGISTPYIFSDHMVLQRDVAVPVWGSADAGAAVTVEFAGQSRQTKADEHGAWTVRLDPLSTSAAGRTLVVTAGAESKKFEDVLVGEVWVASGQSNMEMPLAGFNPQLPTTGGRDDIAAANYPHLRFIVVPKVKDASTIQTNWSVCTPETVESRRLTAVGFHFARELMQKLTVPIGLIETSWGGTRIEAWISPQGYATEPSLKPFEVSAMTTTQPYAVENSVPCELYRPMVETLVPYAIRGAIWYQGESSVFNHDGDSYRIKMRALVSGWRAVWGRGDFPFYFVQIAPFTYAKNEWANVSRWGLPMLWDAQRRSLEIPHTGMVVTTDLVDDIADIHPAQKREVGRRLSLWALNRDYGMKDLECSGPLVKSVRADGAKLVLEFDHAAGLKTRDGKAPSYFEIAGAAGGFKPATASIENGAIVVTSPEVAEPMAVRFAWDELAMPNLVNGDGLPASPFRIDVPKDAPK